MRPSPIIILILALGACAAAAWLCFAPHSGGSSQDATQQARDFFKPPQDYKTSGGQQMKPRW